MQCEKDIEYQIEMKEREREREGETFNFIVYVEIVWSQINIGFTA